MNTRFHLQRRQDANAHLFTADHLCHCIPFLLIQSAIRISHLSFFPVVPFASTLCFSSFPSHLPPFFDSHKDVYILVTFLCFWLCLHPWTFSCLSAQHSIFCSVLCSESFFEDTRNLDLPP